MSAKRKADLRVRRVYDEPSPEDGFRVLVDRLWPRGLSKDKAKVDLWAKALAPSDALRKDAHSDEGFPENEKSWTRFVKRYDKELETADADRKAAVEEIRERLKTGPVTLLYGLKNETRNHAVLLRDWLRSVV